MAESSRRRNTIIAVLVVLLILLLLLFTQCRPEPELEPAPAPPSPSAAPAPPTSGDATAGTPAAPTPPEVLTPATLTVPPRVAAGAAFPVAWTGPDNRGDYVTIVPPEAASADYGNYTETHLGPTLQITAPIEPGEYEVRYVAVRSHTVLARAAIEVDPAGATLDAPEQVTLGSKFAVDWTGPNNKGDYLTIVARDAPDASYGSYADTSAGSPAALTAPTLAGACEIRYVTGQAKKVLARRPIRIMDATVTLDAPDRAIAGAVIEVAWTGPDNAGDYVTIVPSDTPDGRYGNYTPTGSGSPLELLVPIMAGEAELRYMTGQGNRVLARRPIRIVAAVVTLAAPAEGKADTALTIEWTGPNNRNDYITIVPKDTPDDRYGAYTDTARGSPLTVKLPKTPGEAEIRYVAGQGNKVLQRLPVRVVP